MRLWLSSVGIAVLLVLSIVGPSNVEAQSTDDTPRPKTALVLSGGGARGGAHLAVLRVLEQERVPIDLIVGTSIGAIVGGLYASGMPVDEIEEALTTVDWEDLFTDRPPRRTVSFRQKQDDDRALFQFEMGVRRNGIVFPAGLVAGQKVDLLFDKLTLSTVAIETFDDLPIPFRAVATDLSSGEVVVLSAGSLSDAMRASMAIPGLLTPVERDGRFLADGGLVRNLPVEEARALGAERIIAVDISSPLEKFSGDSSLFGVAAQSIELLTYANIRTSQELLTADDLLLQPDLGDLEVEDFPRMLEGVSLTRKQLEQTLDQFGPFAVNEQNWNRWRDGVRSAATKLKRPRIDAIRVRGVERVHPKTIARRIRTRSDAELDLVTLEQDLLRIYRLGEFQRVNFNIQRDDEQFVLEIEADEKDWGPNYLRLGLGLESNFEGRSEFTLLGILTRTQINDFGAEWKTTVTVGDVDGLTSEFYQPLSHAGRWFVSPQVEIQRDEFRLFDPNGADVITTTDLWRGRFDVGLQFQHFGELRLGTYYGRSNSDSVGGQIGNQRRKSAGYRLLGSIDRLDNANFPRRGGVLEFEYRRELVDLGADSPFERLELRWAQAGTLGRNTLVGTAGWGSHLGSALPTDEQFSIGGFLRVSGLEPEQARGSVFGYAALVYYREVGRMPQAVGGGVYIGGAIEAGNVWDEVGLVEFGDLRSSILLYAGADTVFGPVYVGYGLADQGEDAVYLFLGRPF